MTNHPHPECHDSALHSEIELLGDLMAAAARATAHLTDEELDAALDVEGTRAHPASDAGQPPESDAATS